MARLALTALLALAALSAVANAKVKTLVTFGTVLSDSGLPYGYWSFTNKTAPAQGCGFWMGRATNGPVWHEYTANRLNLRSLSFSAGAATVNTIGVKEPITLDGMIRNFKDFVAKEPKPLDKPVILFEMGQHDIFDSFFYVNYTARGITNYTFYDNITLVIEKYAQEMIDSGYKTIVIANEAASYLFPNVRGAAWMGAQMRPAVAYVNANISSMVARLQAKNPTAKVLMFDLFAKHSDITNNPEKYGFKNGTANCMNSVPADYTQASCKLTNICKFPTKFVYWDSAHVSTDGMRVLGKKLENFLKNHKLA